MPRYILIHTKYGVVLINLTRVQQFTYEPVTNTIKVSYPGFCVEILYFETDTAYKNACIQINNELGVA